MLADDDSKWRGQRFAVSHLHQDSFKAGVGLRAYNVHRDLGVIEATNGLVKAHVVRAAQPCVKGDTGGRHKHDTLFQFVYMLKAGRQCGSKGTASLPCARVAAGRNPPGIVHEVLDYSDDREVVEIIMPAKFDTIDV
jgi:hypothetical protein